jgi:PPOX class probable F420-dependent enzyme
MTTELPPEVLALVDGPHMAHLATVRPDGDPSVLPIWLGRDDDRLVICTGRASRKTRNVEHHPHVAVSIVSMDDPYEMAVIRGTVNEVRNDDDLALMDRLSHVYTGKPFPFRDGGRVALFVVPTWCTQRKLPFEHTPG